MRNRGNNNADSISRPASLLARFREAVFKQVALLQVRFALTLSSVILYTYYSLRLPMDSSPLVHVKASHMDSPSVMQQALQTFQANADAQTFESAFERTKTVALQTEPVLRIPAMQQQLLPMTSSTPPSAAGQSMNVQQQLMWQQALQTLAVAPPYSAGGGPTATPFLASLTFPHLMQYNLQQSTQQLQPQQPFAAMMHSMPPPYCDTKRSNSTMSSDNSGEVARNKLSQKKQKQSTASSKKQGPSVVSLGSSSRIGALHIEGMDNLQPPTEKCAADLDKMSPAERRRYERNLREQHRSYRISQQIKELRDVLQDSKVPFRPNKYSILVSVAEYIQQLQGRAIMIDSEHQRLVNTIRCTTEAMENFGKIGSTGTSLTSNSDAGDEDNTNGVLASNSSGDGACSEPIVQGIDYHSVFQHCPYPLGVATLDGRVISSNRELETLLNPSYEHCPMIDQSFFVFIRNHQEIFEAMAALLKRSAVTTESGKRAITKAQQLLFWRGQVVTSRNRNVRLVCEKLLISPSQISRCTHFYFSFPLP